MGLSVGEWAAILIPLVLIQVVLLVWALWDLAHRRQVKGGSRLAWLLVILFVNTLGAILYLSWGREP